MFGRLGGPDAADAARNWLADPNDANVAMYVRVCGPHYTQAPGNVFEAAGLIRTPGMSEELVDALPPHLVRFERFERCGHVVSRDHPDRAFALLRKFIVG